MRKTVVGTAIVVMACVAVAQAAVVTIQDQTTDGTDSRVHDSLLMPDLSFYAGTESDGNYGAEQTLRFYPDTASSYGDTTKYGPRHLVFNFDTAFFDAVPDPQVTSAKFRFYIHPRNTSSGCVAYTNMQLSRFLGGKDWIEGAGIYSRVPGGFTPQPGAAALDGEVTWNSQKHNANPAWATPGATGADTDIDIASTKTFTIASSAHTGELRLVEVDVTDFVQAWANGTAENNGMIVWGGTTGSVGAAVNWNAIMSENPGGESWWSMSAGALITTDISYRPSVVVEYTPEPASALFLGLGLLPILRRRR
jgi:hypothetical protein